jgi:hypothetical protein
MEAALMTATIIKMAVQRMICTGCGAEANASCNCGVAYMPAGQRAAQAVAEHPEKSNRAIAAELGVDEGTVRRVRSSGAEFSAPERKSGGENSSPEKRIGLDGKQYSAKKPTTPRLRVVVTKMDLEIAVIERRKVFMRCASDAIRKAQQGAGLIDAEGSEIDDEVLDTLKRVIEAWTTLRDTLEKRRNSDG